MALNPLVFWCAIIGGVVSLVMWPAITAGVLLLWITHMALELFRSPLHRIPGPRCLDPRGMIFQIMKEGPYVPQLRWAKEFGNIICYRRFPFTYMILVNDPDAIKRICVTNIKNYKKPFELKLFKDVVGNGLLSLEGADHARAKRHIAPAFAFAHLKHSFAPIFIKHARAFADKWSAELKANQREIDVHSLLTKLTLDIIGVSAFSYEFQAVERDDNRIYHAYTDMLNVAALSYLNILPGGERIPTAGLRKSRAAIKMVRAQVDTIIDARRRTIADTATTTPAGGEDAKDATLVVVDDTKPTDLLGIMIHARDDNSGKHVFTNENIVDQTLTFMIAGHETTSVGLSWLFYLLSRNQSVQTKLRDEITSVLRDDADAIIDWDLLKQLPFLNAVIKETLRLYPPAPITARNSVKDDTLCGYDIPGGTRIMISPGVLGRLPCFWQDPDVFQPERWLPGGSASGSSEDGESIGARSKPSFYHWLPFLAGDHACIGQRFAMLEMAALVAVLVPRFQFDMTDKQIAAVRPKLFVTMRPYPHLFMNVTPRA